MNSEKTVGPLSAAIEALDRGQVVAIPTDTVYGLAARMDRPEARERIYELKRRPSGLELPVLVADADQAWGLALAVPAAAHRLADRFWPGALTIIVPAEGGGTVGLRVPANDLVVELCRACGPLATTSANLHGEPPLTTAIAVANAFGGDLLVVDGGTCDGAASTVVDCTVDPPALLREGAISWTDVQRTV